MKAYGHINFQHGGEKGAMQQNVIMRDLNDLGIITVTDDWLNEQFEMDRKEVSGCSHHYVLHNLREIRAFRKLMNSPKYVIGMEGIHWKITLKEGHDGFKKWLERKGLETDEQGAKM